LARNRFLGTRRMEEADTSERIVLVALQTVDLVVTLCFSASPWSWMHWLPDSVGVHSCGDNHECWMEQLIYRTTLAAFLLFVVLATLALRGYMLRHWHKIVLGAFTMILLPLLLTFMPNGLFDVFAKVATVVSTVFLIAQTALLVDFAQACNDTICSAGLSARLVHINSDYLQAAKLALTGVSLALLIGAITGAIILWMHFPNGWIVVTALVVSALLLVVSITKWCTHGNLFASAIVTAYSVWLSYDVLVMRNEDYDQRVDFTVGFKVSGLIITFFTLIASIFGSGWGLAGPDSLLGGGAASNGRPNPRAFAVYSVLNAVATLYVASVLTPTQSGLGFVVRVVALMGSLLLYGWMLLAPLVMPRHV